MTADRLAELADNLDAVRGRVVAACRAAGRAPGEVTLVAVSKTWPASDVLLLASLGVTHFGESYDQDAARKAAELSAAGVDVRWHFIGRLQRNKARSVGRYADCVHSVDRPELVPALDSAVARAGRPQPLDVLVQVSYDDDPARGGCAEGDLPAMAALVDSAASLRLRGVMTVPPLGADPRPVFARLRRAAEALRESFPQAAEVSAGMTGDLEDAVAEGATLVRIGTALFGYRAARG